MINFVTERNVIGEDCYFDNSRFDVAVWDYFKRLTEPDFVNNSFRFEKPCEFSRDFIFKAFQPLRSKFTNMIIRDQEFQFVSYFESHPYLDCQYIIERDAYQVTFKYK